MSYKIYENHLHDIPKFQLKRVPATHKNPGEPLFFWAQGKLMELLKFDNQFVDSNSGDIENDINQCNTFYDPCWTISQTRLETHRISFFNKKYEVGCIFLFQVRMFFIRLCLKLNHLFPARSWFDHDMAWMGDHLFIHKVAYCEVSLIIIYLYTSVLRNNWSITMT